jgi:hypothetical protein
LVTLVPVPVSIHDSARVLTAVPISVPASTSDLTFDEIEEVDGGMFIDRNRHKTGAR